jgi:hypothetical protein
VITLIRLRRGAAYFLGVVLLSASGAYSRPLQAQESDGSTAGAVGAAALGAYSGTFLGLTGSLVPCSQRTSGLLCTRVSAVVAGVLGGASGAVIGANDSDLAWNHARNAGIGAAVGSVTGLFLRRVVRHYGWWDAGAGAVLGAAIGAAPAGAGIGFASGALVGTVLWQAVPSFEVADAVALGLGGMALGGLASWVVSAVSSAEDGGEIELYIPLNALFELVGW